MQLLYKVVVHLSLADFSMNEYIIRFVTRIIGCFAMLGSLWLLSKIETLNGFDTLIFTLAILVVFLLFYEVYFLVSKNKSKA